MGVEKFLVPLNVKLNIPLFPSGPSQLLKDETTESIHIERIITQIKKF